MPSPRLPADETGHDPMRREEASLCCRPVSSRYGRGAMIITTNKSIRDRTEPLAGDGVPATAILDRLLRRAPVLDIKGRSCRLRDPEAAPRGRPVPPAAPEGPRPRGARARSLMAVSPRPGAAPWPDTAPIRMSP